MATVTDFFMYTIYIFNRLKFDNINSSIMLAQIKYSFIISTLTILSVYSKGQELYSQLIQAENLKQHVYVLASDSMQGRETGFSGQKKAAAYIASEFARAGLISLSKETDSSAYLQRIIFINRTGNYAEVKCLEKNVKSTEKSSKVKTLNLKNGLLYYGERYKTSNEKMEVIYAGREINPGSLFFKGDTSNALFLTARNTADGWILIKQAIQNSGFRKIFLYLPYDEYMNYFDEYITGQYMKGAGDNDTIMYGTDIFSRKKIENNRKNDRMMQDFVTSLPGLQLFLVSDNGAAKLFGKSGEGIYRVKPGTMVNTMLSADFNPEFTEYTSENVIGMIEGGKYKNQYIVIGAHYDHVGKSGDKIFYGADDNASGTAAVIEVAKAFAAASMKGYQPDRSILFMAFTGEEKGLLGSDFFVKMPLCPLDSIALMINMDMIGRTDKNHFSGQDYTYIMTVGKHKRPVKKMAKIATSTIDGFILDKRPGLIGRIGYFFGSDHYSFRRKGVPAVVFFSGLHRDYHTPQDTPDKIKYQQMEKTARMIFELAIMASQSKKIYPNHRAK